MLANPPTRTSRQSFMRPKSRGARLALSNRKAPVIRVEEEGVCYQIGGPGLPLLRKQGTYLKRRVYGDYCDRNGYSEKQGEEKSKEIGESPYWEAEEYEATPCRRVEAAGPDGSTGSDLPQVSNTP